MNISIRQISLTAALVPLILLVSQAPAAEAASVVSDGATITIAAAPGELNNVVTPISGDQVDESMGQLLYPISDSANTSMVAGPGCQQSSPTSVICFAAQLPALLVDLGDGDDSIDPQPPADPFGRATFSTTFIQGGAGDDDLGGTYGSDQIVAGPGDDQIDPTLGTDSVDAGAGDDRFSSAPGDVDPLNYMSETIRMGPGADSALHRGVGDQVSYIRIWGGSGPDRIGVRGLGRYSVSGGAGADRINTRDQLPPVTPSPLGPLPNLDSVNCGASRGDKALVDSRERRIEGCEFVHR